MLKFVLAVKVLLKNQAYVERAINSFSSMTIHKSFTLYDKDVKRSMRFIKTLYYIKFFLGLFHKNYYFRRHNQIKKQLNLKSIYYFTFIGISNNNE